MKSIEEYVAAVSRRLPRWHPRKSELLTDLERHLEDRVSAGEIEVEVVSSMEDPEAYALALVQEVALTPAPLGRRAVAFAIDAALGLPVSMAGIILCLLAVKLISGNPPTEVDLSWIPGILELRSTSIFHLVAILAGVGAVSVFLLSLIYFPVVETIWGTTIGKHLVGLGVVTQDGMRMNLTKAIVRRLPFYFEFFLLDAVFAFFSDKGQRAFDRVARTMVIRYPTANGTA